MDYIRTKLAPGVMLTQIDPDRHKTDVIYVNLILPLSAENATSLTLLSKVLTRGTAAYPTFRELSAACDDAYACGLDAFTVKQGEALCLSFAATFLKNEFATEGEDIFTESLRLLGGLIFAPYLPQGRFSEDYVNREKAALREQIMSLFNNKPAYALRRAVGLMCEGEPYSVPAYGDLETLEGQNAEKLTNAYKNALQTAPVEIIFVGKSHPGFLDKINEYLPFIPRGDRLPVVKFVEKAEKTRVFNEKADASQSTLVLGFRTGGRPWREDFTAFTVFNEIFALSPVSKLFMNVRERLSLCYYCNTFGDRLKGILTVAAGIDAKNFLKAKKAILGELEAIKTGNFTETEYQDAVRSAVNSYREIADRPGQLCSYYVTRALQGEFFTPDEEIKRLTSLPQEDIVRVANNLTLDTVYLLEGTRI